MKFLAIGLSEQLVKPFHTGVGKNFCALEFLSTILASTWRNLAEDEDNYLKG